MEPEEVKPRATRAYIQDKRLLNSSEVTLETRVPAKKNWVWKVKKIMNPPIYATLITIPLALIPYMKEYVISGSGAVLRKNVFLAFTKIGAAVSPLVSLLLGSKFTNGYPPSADITW